MATMASTPSRLPTEVIGRIMRYVSHPCADLIRQLGLVHEHPPWVWVFMNGINGVISYTFFMDGHNDASGWIWAHRSAHLRENKRLCVSDTRALEIRSDILLAHNEWQWLVYRAR